MKYLCFDTALNEEYTLVKLLQRYPRRISLFAGTDDVNIWDAAPWLFEVEDNFFELRNDRLIQLRHCILFETKESIEALCSFLQYYIYERSGGRAKYIRIWDARVLLKYLQTWPPLERKSFFDGLVCFYTENDQDEYFDKWTPGNLYAPVATKVLKTAVLPVVHSEAAPSEERDRTDKIEDTAESSPTNGNAVTGDAVEKPKRRRFFIE